MAFTYRQVEVLRLMARGFSNTRIAAELGVSKLTAIDHIRTICAKLKVDNRTGAVVVAMQLGFIRLEEIEVERV